jgi:hypothetical protein
MAFSEIADALYVIDILYYTVIDGCWGIGGVNNNKFETSSF